MLHMPPNSLSRAAFLEIDLLGKGSFLDATMMCSAARARSSITTIPEWPALLAELRSAADDFLPLGAGVRGRLSPSFWVDKPIALLLSESFHSLPGSPPRPGLPFAEGPLQLLGSVPAPGLKGVQARIATKIIPNAAKGELGKILVRRATALAEPVVGTAAWYPVAKALEKHSRFLTMIVVKTLMNACTTSERMHDERNGPASTGAAEKLTS